MDTPDSWRKSSYSGANGGECVEVATTTDSVLVRDTRDRDGNLLNVPARAWRAFVSTLK
jgi:hypothetical protein